MANVGLGPESTSVTPQKTCPRFLVFFETNHYIVVILSFLFDFLMTTTSLAIHPLCFLVTVAGGLVGNGINDSSVVGQLLVFVFSEGVQVMSFGVPYNLMRFDDLGLAQFLWWMLEFVEHVVSYDVIIVFCLRF